MYMYIYIYICFVFFVQQLRSFPRAECSGLLGMQLGLVEGSLGKTKTSWNVVWGAPELSWRPLGEVSGSLGFPRGSLGGGRGSPPRDPPGRSRGALEVPAGGPREAPGAARGEPGWVQGPGVILGVWSGPGDRRGRWTC